MRCIARRLLSVILVSLLTAVPFATPVVGQKNLPVPSDEKDQPSASEILAAGAEKAARENDRKPADPPAPPEELGQEQNPQQPPVAEGSIEPDGTPLPNDVSQPDTDTKAGSEPSETEPIEAANYRGIVPGSTSQESLHEQWGQPDQVHRIPGGARETYSSEAFQYVRVTVIEDVVDSLTLKMKKPRAVDEVAERLQITDLEPVDLFDDEGQWLGQTYPERGILLGFDPQSEQPRVARIVIEPINAAPFLARAETRVHDRFADCLADLQQARRLAPESSRTYALEAEVLLRCGDLDPSIKAAQKAIEMDPDDLGHRLMLSTALTAAGEHRQAIRHARDVVDAHGAAPITLAKAHCRLADSLAAAPEPDFKQAVKHHMQAAELVASLAKSEEPTVRIAAKEVLLDAYLGAAHDIGHGHWQQQSTVVPRWIKQAQSVAEDIIHNEHGNEETRLRVYESALAAAAGIDDPPNPGPWIDGLTELGGVLVRQSEDEAHRAHLAWRLGVALADATEIETARGNMPRAMQLGNMAMAYFSQGEAAGEQLPTHDYLRGWLCYRMGAIYAVNRHDHRQAVDWFRQAVPLLESPMPRSAAANPARQGETFVSIAVSYWELGQRDEALRLTVQGLELMERAAADGKLDKAALTVPYGNLARMHKLLGDAEQSRDFEELATRAEALGRK
jgi:tetratricopeptide (TPR) repeat protein